MAESSCTVTSLRTHPSLSVSFGRPYSPAGRSISIGVGEDPIVMSTSSPVSRTIRSATRRTFAWLRSSEPVTPATRIRITLIGALAALGEMLLNASESVRLRSERKGAKIIGGC